MASFTAKFTADVRERLKKEFPKFTFSVSKEDFAGGWSVTVTIAKGSIRAFTTEPKKYYDVNQYHYQSDENLTNDMKKFLEKLLEVLNRMGSFGKHSSSYLHVKIGGKNPYEVKGESSSTSKSSNSEKKQWDKGELMRECAGWKIYKKTLPDGRIVHNIYKNPETPANKEKWDEIKGSIYTDTGFKWGRFGAFEKWGIIVGEENMYDKVCEILSAYYTSKTTDKKEEEQNYVLFEYGKSWEVDDADGIVLVNELKLKGYEIFYKSNNPKEINIQLLDYPEMTITDNGGEFNLTDAKDKFHIASVGYIDNKIPAAPKELAIVIDDYYREYFLIDSEPKKEKEFIYDHLHARKGSGQKLVDYLREKGFEVEVIAEHTIEIQHPDYEIKMSITTNDKLQELRLYDFELHIFYGAIPYLKQGFPIDYTILAHSIENDYKEFSKQRNASMPSSKQEIQDTINALKYLADAGDEDAKSTIEALKYLI